MLRRLAAIFGLIASVTTFAHAQPSAVADYPAKPIRLLVPFPAGSAIDTITRTVTAKMAPALGKPIIVEPMPGGGSVLATQYAIRQPSDGYTLVVVTNSATIKSALPKPPFDVRRDLTMVGQFSGSPMFLAVNSDVPARNVQELVAYAKSHPDKLNLSSYGIGTLSHLAGELFLSRTGAKMVHVPYPGSTANGQALAQGATQVTFDVLNSLRPHQQRGAIRFLAVTSATRTTDAPELPTLLESGVQGIDIEVFGGLAAPAGTPVEIVQKLNAALNVALKDPAVIDFFERTGFGVMHEGTSVKGFTEKVNTSVDVFSQLIRDARLDIE